MAFKKSLVFKVTLYDIFPKIIKRYVMVPRWEKTFHWIDSAQPLQCVYVTRGISTMRENVEATKQLKTLLKNSFDTEAAMKLVRLGANPDTKSKNGKSLLHILSTDENNENGKNDEAIAVLNPLAIKYNKERHHQPRNNLLNLLLLLVNEKTNKYSHQECSRFKFLPIDIICHIVSFLDFKSMGKSREEVMLLTNAAYSQHQKIREMTSTPGGINVFQRGNTFTFFKSVHTFCLDFEKLKTDLMDEQKHKHPILDKLIGTKLPGKCVKKLDDFTEKYAISYWNEHASLYNKPANQQKLLESIKKSEPYNKIELG